MIWLLKSETDLTHEQIRAKTASLEEMAYTQATSCWDYEMRIATASLPPFPQCSRAAGYHIPAAKAPGILTTPEDNAFWFKLEELQRRYTPAFKKMYPVYMRDWEPERREEVEWFWRQVESCFDILNMPRRQNIPDELTLGKLRGHEKFMLKFLMDDVVRLKNKSHNRELDPVRVAGMIGMAIEVEVMLSDGPWELLFTLATTNVFNPENQSAQSSVDGSSIGLPSALESNIALRSRHQAVDEYHLDRSWHVRNAMAVLFRPADRAGILTKREDEEIWLHLEDVQRQYKTPLTNLYWIIANGDYHLPSMRRRRFLRLVDDCFYILKIQRSPIRDAELTHDLLNRAAMYMHQIMLVYNGYANAIISNRSLEHHRRIRRAEIIAEMDAATRNGSSSAGLGPLHMLANVASLKSTIG